MCIANRKALNQTGVLLLTRKVKTTWVYRCHRSVFYSAKPTEIVVTVLNVGF